LLKVIWLLRRMKHSLLTFQTVSKSPRQSGLYLTKSIKWTNLHKSSYSLEIGDSKRHPTFHVSDIKRYVDPHLELFPNQQHRQPPISESEKDLSLEIEHIVGHRLDQEAGNGRVE
jgi:hypothetical protein